MIAVDTNVLIRAIVADDPEQAARAREILRSAPIWLPRTVLLELEWVLRGVYRFPKDQVRAAIERLLSTEGIVPESPSVVRRAVAWHREGLDLADALHLAASEPADEFISFDRRFVTTAARLGTEPGAAEA